MKIPAASAASPRKTIVVCAAALLAGGALGFAQIPPAGQVTQVVKTVRLLSPDGAARGVAAGQPLSNGSALRTAADGRAEVQFSDRTLARLGGNTLFRVKNGSSDLQLQDGAVLFRAPKTARGARITTARVTAEIAGSTGLFERFGAAYFKLLVLEGTARVYLPQVGESVLVQPGQMLISKPDAQVLPDPVHFSIDSLYRTSALIGAPFRQLPSHSAIQGAVREQKANPQFAQTNLVIYGRGTLVNLLPPTEDKPTKPAQRNSGR